MRGASGEGAGFGGAILGEKRGCASDRGEGVCGAIFGFES
jgi:hypothetical protein